ncbi:MAG: DUF5662 family protein [Rickettsiales bacterium]|jgi:hypothetical protein|nr:DUF5662 family protein [Rickettsiales bacterium]
MEQIRQIWIEIILWHNGVVTKLMTLLETNKQILSSKIDDWSLIQRGLAHDLDKINDTNFANAMCDYYYDRFVLKKKDGISDDYLLKYKAHEHYLTNPHHQQYHLQNNTKPTAVDICEMVCDFIAASRKHKKYDGIKNSFDLIFSYQPTKQFIIDTGYEKFKEIADLLDSFNLSEDFFGEDPFDKFRKI